MRRRIAVVILIWAAALAAAWVLTTLNWVIEGRIILTPLIALGSLAACGTCLYGALMLASWMHRDG